MVPLGATFAPALGDPFEPAVQARYAERETFGNRGIVHQGLSAELLADRWDLTRAELDALALRSQLLATEARDAGRFADEIIPVQSRQRNPETGEVVTGDDVTTDGGIRETTAEGLAGLRPAFLPDGRVTAGNSSQISDGAAAVLIMSEDEARRRRLEPLARITQFAVAADDPVAMLTAPIPATRKLLARAGITIEDIDLFEINEAFASVVLAWQTELGVPLDRLNVNGGAIALGHPLGASGARITTTLVHELRRRGGRRGFQTMCEGGGLANATLFETIS